jgi:hypothetical protein
MRCGHCGSEVHEGFTTCFNCGAVYCKRGGPLSALIGCFAVACFMLGAMSLFLGGYELCLSCFGLCGASWILLQGLAAITPRLWWR